MNLVALKERAAQLGITEEDIKYNFGGTQKKYWQQAVDSKEKFIADQALAAEAEEENRQALRQQIYQSPGAAVIVPVAAVAAYGQGLFRAVKRCSSQRR